MSEQTTEAKAENGGVKKTPATFRAILGEKIGMTQIFHPKDGAERGGSLLDSGVLGLRFRRLLAHSLIPKKK